MPYFPFFGGEEYAYIFILIIILVVPTGIIQLLIGLIFNFILSPGNIEISGVKMWLFYAFELFIGFAVLTWCKQSAFW